MRINPTGRLVVRLFVWGVVGLALGACTDPDTTSVTGTGTSDGGSADSDTTMGMDSLSDISASIGSTGMDGMMDATDGVDSTGVDDATGDTGMDTTGTTGDPPQTGQTRTELVSSGTRMSNGSYTMIFTLGQPSIPQGTHVSSGYRMQGGLVGANGSPP